MVVAESDAQPNSIEPRKCMSGVNQDPFGADLTRHLAK